MIPLLIANIVIVLIVFFVLYTKMQKPQVTDTREAEELKREVQRLESVIKDEMSRNRQETNSGQKDLRTELGGTLTTTLTQMTQAVEQKLTSLQQDNSQKLEQMRETVDEKLHATLEKRFGESFKLVSDRLDQVHKGLGEMQTIAIGVGDLKKVLSNVKTRGTWGEAQLGNLIEEIMTADQYEKNVMTKKGSRDAVEYAIKLPGNGDVPHVWLPIDAKFPLDDYQRLIESEDRADLIYSAELRKSLENRIKSEAKDIHTKYIDVPYTTDFGILFVPIESLYAEILRIPGLFESIRRDYKVIVTGPTTIQAILNSLHMGFRTLSIQKRSSEVWEVLGVVKKEFGKFGDLLEKTQEKLNQAGKTIEDAVKKTRTIEKKLGKVGDSPLLENDSDAVVEAVIDVLE